MNIKIKFSGKKGKGVFADRNFKKKDIILYKDYRKHKNIVEEKNIFNISENDQNHIDYIGRKKYAIDYSAFCMVNHSCEPNSYIIYKNFLVKYLVAMRNISKGEEICADYVLDTAGKWKMKCCCGSKRCRRTIYSNYFKLPKDLQIKYWKYVPRWKKRVLNQTRP